MTSNLDEDMEGLELFDEEEEGETENNTSTTQAQHNKNKVELEKKETPAKVRRNFYIREDLDERLNDLSDKTELSKSQLVDKALSFLFDNIELK